MGPSPYKLAENQWANGVISPLLLGVSPFTTRSTSRGPPRPWVCIYILLLKLHQVMKSGWWREGSFPNESFIPAYPSQASIWPYKSCPDISQTPQNLTHPTHLNIYSHPMGKFPFPPTHWSSRNPLAPGDGTKQNTVAGSGGRPVIRVGFRDAIGTSIWSTITLPRTHQTHAMPCRKTQGKMWVGGWTHWPPVWYMQQHYEDKKDLVDRFHWKKQCFLCLYYSYSLEFIHFYM